MRVALVTVLIALTVAPAACSSSGGDTGEVRSFGESGPSTVTVEVNNRGFERSTIHWQTRGIRHRLGVVEGVTSRTFTIERFTVSQPVQLEINQTAGNRCITGEIYTDPGDHLYLEIAPNFRDTQGCI